MEMYRNALRNNRDRLREAGVAGSIPVTPTNKIKITQLQGNRVFMEHSLCSNLYSIVILWQAYWAEGRRAKYQLVGSRPIYIQSYLGI
ncbi:hypothetical protein EP47_07380 [Legionella norrlandica]|uniref:Uncharacterized protein n=1 Tax=Legionella norrlandica TaxID=1498499 RepID=A0A0A2SS60_9GAMM|nr:hypothetical protein EP47_07380 [Legionella norrlandica]